MFCKDLMKHEIVVDVAEETLFSGDTSLGLNAVDLRFDLGKVLALVTNGRNIGTGKIIAVGLKG
jgi:hypothetical protein